MKKIPVLVISIFAFLVSFTAVFAQESYDVKHDDESEILVSIGVSPEPPYLQEVDEGEVSIHGIDPPHTRWDWGRGQMNFAGKADRSSLYTNYLFTGSSDYRLEIKNLRNDTLEVDLIEKRSWWSDRKVTTYTVQAKSTGYRFPSGLDSDGEYYLKFYAPSEFSGNLNRR